jgi:outer membrane lipopolysaccharide assembly protein LptE/RlpB
MKKLIVLFLAIMMILTLTACGGKRGGEKSAFVRMARI